MPINKPSDEVIKIFTDWLEFENQCRKDLHERKLKEIESRKPIIKYVPYFSSSDKKFIVFMFIFILITTIVFVLLA